MGVMGQRQLIYPRYRTTYQKQLVGEIMAFCKPDAKTKKGQAALNAIPKEERKHLLARPFTVVLEDNGTVGMYWFDYASCVDKRTSVPAMGAVLDWCDERGVQYAKIDRKQVPGIQYCRSVAQYYGGALRITIPRGE